MFCHKCGARIAEGAGFCHKCGERAVLDNTIHQESASSSEMGKSHTQSQPKSLNRIGKVGTGCIYLGLVMMVVWLVGFALSPSYSDRTYLSADELNAMSAVNDVLLFFIMGGAALVFIGGAIVILSSRKNKK